jgi:hypothetical protein
VIVYTTCAGCGDPLRQHYGWHQTRHPACGGDDSPTGDGLTDRYLVAVESGDDATADTLAAACDTADQRDRTRPMLPAALAYAASGWPVFPLRPRDKVPATRHGLKDATTDPAVIRSWWTATPAANIGVVTGERFDVVDVDAPIGMQVWPDLRDSPAMPPVHGIATTPRGGLHVLIEPTGGGNRAGFLPGIDFRGRGGYIVVSPSRRDAGRWSWAVRPSPAITGADLYADRSA